MRACAYTHIHVCICICICLSVAVADMARWFAAEGRNATRVSQLPRGAQAHRDHQRLPPCTVRIPASLATRNPATHQWQSLLRPSHRGFPSHGTIHTFLPYVPLQAQCNWPWLPTTALWMLRIPIDVARPSIEPNHSQSQSRLSHVIERTQNYVVVGWRDMAEAWLPWLRHQRNDKAGVGSPSTR